MPERTQLRDRYELKDVLGRGGMGVVYRAWDSLMKREVAVKTVLEVDNPVSLDLFFREWGVLASMVHPNIISIYDIGEVEIEGVKRPFFVMPLLPGLTLDRLIRQGSPRLTVPRLVDIIAQASRGLQAAHDMELIHRDVKPSNIFVLDDDSVKLIDFGIARLTTSSSQTSLKGTLSYVSPEQLQLKPPSPLSDQYSLGVVAYEAFTRRTPFTGGTDGDTIQAILHSSPPPVSELNNSVNYAISQVVHKALAKNPWNRFPNTKEFGESLQKAFRGEAIEYFDVSRVKPRLQRALESFEQGDYEFASDILAEIESEGHLNQEVVMVRRQVEQANRRKRIGALLDSARRFHQAHEYTLALRKVQEALDLDGNDPDVLALKALIEKERRSRKIDEWIQIARQHLGNQSFQQARDAVDKVLKMKPDDTEALRLMADVRRGEQELARTRERKSQMYRQAMEAWQRGDVTSALGRLDVLASLERDHPDADTSVARSFQSFYNQVRSEHDSLRNKYTEARRLLTEDRFEEALAISKTVLSKYPNHALFQALEYDIQERKSQKLSAAIAETDGRVEQEPDLDKRVAILEEATKLYPDEKHFEQALRLVRDKRDLVNSIIAKARYYEEQQHFNEAFDQWQIVGSIHERYPGLSFELERLTKRRQQQAREAAKSRWVEQVDRMLESGDYARAETSVHGALTEFPTDPELLELEKLVQKSTERAEQAQRVLERAREFIDISDPDKAIPLLREASQLDSRNPVIRAVLANTLLESARRLVQTDPEQTEVVLKELLALDPNHPGAVSLTSQLSDRKREESVTGYLASARRLQTDGDIEGAVGVVDQGLKTYPHEPRLHQLRSALERSRVETKQHISVPAGLTGQPGPAGNGQPSSKPIEPAPAQSAPAIPTPGAEAPKAEAPKEAPGARPSAPETKPIIPPPIVPPVIKPATPADMRTEVVPNVIRQPRERPAAKISSRPSLGDRRGLPRLGRNWIYGAGLAFVAVWLVITLVRWYADKNAPEPQQAPVTRPVSVRATPDGAEIRIDDQMCGVSNCSISLTPGIHRATATLSGHEPASVNVYVPEGASGTVPPVEMKLVPVSPLLAITTNLEGATLALDEAAPVPMQSTELLLKDLADGEHTIKLTGGPSEAAFTFQISRTSAPAVSLPFRTRSVNATVVAAFGAGAHVYSTVKDAEVSLDGKPSGPLTDEGLALNALSPGSHEVVLKASSGNTQRVAFEAGPSPALVISAAANLDLGGLRVVTGVDDAKVFINGNQFRRMTQRGRFLVYLPPKKYTVRVEKEGFIPPAEQTVEITQGQETRLDFQLAPIPQTASLVVQGGVPDSEVLLDGRPLGTVQADGRLDAKGIEPGRHTVQVRKERYKPLEAAHDFVAGQSVEVAGTLQAAYGMLSIQVTPSDAPVKLELQREGETTRKPLTGHSVELAEGAYTLLANAPGFQNHTSVVKVASGRTVTATVQLQPVPAPPPPPVAAKPKVDFALTDWETAGGWTRERDMLVRRGGDYVLMSPKVTSGDISFRAVLQKNKHMEWVVHYRDQRNHILYRLEKRELERTQFVNGKKQNEVKVRHSLDLDRPLEVVVTLAGDVVRVSAGSGPQQVRALDSFATGEYGSGKFGFRLPGRDELALAEFRFTPK